MHAVLFSHVYICTHACVGVHSASCTHVPVYSSQMIYGMWMCGYRRWFPEVMFNPALQSALFLICSLRLPWKPWWIALAVCGGTAWVIHKTFLSSPGHTFIKHISPRKHPYITATQTFLLHILKFRCWKQLRGGRRASRSPHKRMNLCPLKSV